MTRRDEKARHNATLKASSSFSRPHLGPTSIDSAPNELFYLKSLVSVFNPLLLKLSIGILHLAGASFPLFFLSLNHTEPVATLRIAATGGPAPPPYYISSYTD